MSADAHTQSVSRQCPRHLNDVDLFAAGAQEHWYEAYPILHCEAPVHRLPGEGLTPDTDAFILSRYDDINRVVKDPIRYTPITSLMLEQMAAAMTPPEDMDYINMMMVSMLTLRPTVELWRAHRKELTDPWVGPGAERHREMITRRVDALIDDLPSSGEVDFVQAFARPLPQQVMAEVLGFPESDIPQLAAQFTQLDGFKEYVQDIVRAKRQSPADDMISFLTQVTYSALDRKLTDLEINGIVYAMVLGGLETTQYALEQQAQLICDRPGLFEALQADSSLLRTFIEESLRLRAPTQGLSTRLTSQGEQFGDVEVPKGSVLHLRWAAANIDPEEVECPMDLQLDRKAASRHLAFSAGPRVCPGAGISRLEQHIAWTRLLERLESMSYGSDNTFLHQPGIMLGTLQLNLELVKAAK